MDHQLPVLLDPSRFKVVVCGRRWGKTALGLLACVRGHGPRRRSLRGAVDGAKIWWVAPTYPIASEIWRDLKKSCRYAWIKKDEVERRIELPGGGSVSVRSADKPESLVAVGLDGLVIDEAARIKEIAWEESLRPTLSDKQGWAVFITTPKGYNWIHRLYQRAAVENGWARWQRPTSDNPLIPQEELELAKRDSPRYYGQEYEAKFTEVEGAEWPAEWFTDSIWFADWPTRIRFRVLALDPSKGKDAKHGDYSAYVDMRVDHKLNLWVEADLARRPTPEMIANGLDLWRSGPAGNWLAVEVNQFQELLVSEFDRQTQELGILPLPIYPIDNHVNKLVRIRRLGSFLSRGRIRFRYNSPGTQLLVQQLRDFPVGEHDDGPDALEMAVRTADELMEPLQRETTMEYAR